MMKKTVLSSRKKIILILLSVTVLLCAAGIILSIIFKPPVVVVLKYDEDGDEVYATVKSKDGSINQSTLNELLQSGKKSKYDVKYGSGNVNYTFRANDAEVSYRPFLIPEIPVKNVKSVEVSNDFGTYKLMVASDGTHYLEDSPNTLLISQPASDIVTLARFMLALEKVKNPSEDLSTYGLAEKDNPAKITITDTSGKSNTALLGNICLSGDGYYMKHVDKPYIYVMDTASAIFEQPVFSIISPILEKPLSENEYSYMDSFQINKNGEEFFKSQISPEKSNGASNLHAITYPMVAIPSLDTYYPALSCLANLSGTSVVEYNVSNRENKDELFETYGLNTPSNELIYSVGSKHCNVIIGNAETSELGSKTYYAYSEYNDCIVVLPEAYVPFLNYTVFDFVNPNIFQYSIENVSSIVVKTPQGESNFVLTGEDRNLKVKETNSGKSIDTESFKQMYISLMNVKAQSFYEETQVSDEDFELSFTVNTKFGKQKSYTFHTLTTAFALANVNSGESYYKVERSRVNKVIENTDKLLNGITITRDY